MSEFNSTSINGEDAVVGEVRIRKSTVINNFNKGSITQSRVFTTFEASNPDHRQHCAFFLKNKRWDDNAPRFYIEHPHISAPAMINAKMLEYYISQDQALVWHNTEEKNN